ncbi:hypothetical protein [Chthoniobacter flavus]|nr:hypothetical protein [Chthoniobacter flavus]
MASCACRGLGRLALRDYAGIADHAISKQFSPVAPPKEQLVQLLT